MCDVKKEWTSAEMTRLLQVYKSMPELWNHSETSYRDKHLKVVGFTKIAKIFGTSLSEIRRKLHNVRCQFTTEIRRLKYKALKNNVHVSDVKSEWRYFDNLRFLLVNYKEFQKDYGSTNANAITDDLDDNTDASRTSIDYLMEDPQSEDETSYDINCKPSTSQGNIIPKSEEIYLPDNDYKVSKKRKASNDDYRIFGEYVASELRNLSEISAKKLKLKIKKAILEVTEEEYNLECATIEYLE